MGDTRAERDASTRRKALREIKELVFEEMLKLFKTSHEDLKERMVDASIEVDDMPSIKTMRRHHSNKETGAIHLAKIKSEITNDQTTRIMLLNVIVKINCVPEKETISSNRVFICVYETKTGYFKCDDLMNYVTINGLKESPFISVDGYLQYNDEVIFRNALRNLIEKVQTKFKCTDINELVFVQKLISSIAETRSMGTKVYLNKYIGSNKSDIGYFSFSATEQLDSFLINQEDLPLQPIELVVIQQKHGTLVKLSNSNVKCLDKYQPFYNDETQAQVAVQKVINECKSIVDKISGANGELYPKTKPKKQKEFKDEYNLKSEKSKKKPWERQEPHEIKHASQVGTIVVGSGHLV